MEKPGSAQLVWMTGLSGAGKTTLCQSVSHRLGIDSHQVIILDGDLIRKGLCADLGFSMEDRTESVRRIAHVAKLIASTGTIVLVAVITPIEAARRIARDVLPDMIQVFVDASLKSCELRDVKGLYAKARRGELKGLTGIDSPFETPVNSQVVCYSDIESIEVCTERILRAMRAAEKSVQFQARVHPRPSTYAATVTQVDETVEAACRSLQMG